jgi:putative PIN family toxin of toxin-antitoxin system
VVQAWLGHEAFELVICPRLLAEVAEVLDRPRLRRWITSDIAARFVETIRLAADLVEDPVDVAAATRDVGDDYLVALAVAHDADYIVTGDKDLLEWVGQLPAVVTPEQFERLLGG